MTRNEIANLKVGDYLIGTIDTIAFSGGKAAPNARWSEPRRVTKIYAQREDINGKMFVCFYTEFGEGAEISGSIKEGEEYYRLYKFKPGDKVSYAGDEYTVVENNGDSGLVRTGDEVVKFYWHFDGEAVKLVQEAKKA